MVRFTGHQHSNIPSLHYSVIPARRVLRAVDRSARYFFFFPNTEPMADLELSPRWRTFNWPRMECQPI